MAAAGFLGTAHACGGAVAAIAATATSAGADLTNKGGKNRRGGGIGGSGGGDGDGHGHGRSGEWLVLEGGFAPDGAPVSCLSKERLSLLRAVRDEIDLELAALDSAPSVPAALRELRRGGATAAEARAAAETALLYVCNVLRHPQNPRVYRVRAANPVFERALGRHAGAADLMAAAGFRPQDRASVFVLQKRGGTPTIASTGGSGSGSALSAATGTAGSFAFPGLDALTEAFLWRRKADLEAAVTALDAVAASGGGNGAAFNGGGATADTAGTAAHAGLVSPRRRTAMAATAAATAAAAGAAAAATTAAGQKQPQARPATSSGGATGKCGAGGSGGGTVATPGTRHAQMTLIRASFERLDAHKEGRLTAAGLRTAFRAVGRDSSERAVAAWIRERDIDQDGTVSLEEFAASLHALVPPETAGTVSNARVARSKVAASTGASAVKGRSPSGAGWASGGSATAASTASGATAAEAQAEEDVRAAFGALRLCASVFECRRAVEAALEYVRRIADAPGAVAHWRIPLSSPEFDAALGRLLGGVALMRSLGFVLEENGTVLALRGVDGSGGGHGDRWERVPEAVLARLRLRGHFLEAHARGLDHPEVSDMAAVAAAVAGLGSNSYGVASYLSCIETASKYVGNVLAHPGELRYRRINGDNAAFVQRVAVVRGGIELMVALGFREALDGAWVLPPDADLAHLAARQLELEAGLPALRQRAAAAVAKVVAARVAAAKAAAAAKLVASRGPKRHGSSGATAVAVKETSASKGGQVMHPGPATVPAQLMAEADASPAVPAVAAATAAASPPLGAASLSAAAAAAAGRMQEQLADVARSRRLADAALEKRRLEVERLREEVADLQDAAAAMLPPRDTFTLSGMPDDDRRRVSRMAVELGLEVPPAAAA
ncbi:unnamed protein product, partial [Phaeothamnion confervicola]